jgi:hypothetical protein
MLPALPAELQRSVAGSITNGMARSDLAAAARWAVSLNDEATRSTAISQVATSWATRDPGAAQSWAAGLPRGALRDQALSSVLSRLARNGFHVSIEDRALEAFDSDEIRGQQVARLVVMIAAEDPERAQSMLEKWVEDPRLRAQGESAIESARRASGLP